MARKRSLFAGMTDYTAVGFKDLLDHLRGWRRSTQDVIDVLRRGPGVVESESKILDDPVDMKDYIESFLGLFSRYVQELDRLLEELPQGVKQSHVEALLQIFQSSAYEERRCIEFKRSHIERRLRSEKMRPFVDKLYEETRGLLQDYRDLSNMADRLKSLVGTTPLIKLQPEFHGLGFNLAGVARRLLGWFRRSRS